MSNTQKWVNGALLGAGLIVFLFLHQLISFVWELSGLPLFDQWPLRPDAILAFALSAGAAAFVRWHTTSNRFLNEVAVELSKVVWPERKETLLSTVVVIAMVGVSSLILFLMDFIWGTLSKRLLNINL